MPQKKAAAARLDTATLNPRLLKDFVTRLQATNLRLFEANTKLLSELDTAHAELDATRNEMALHRESAKRDPLTGLANRAGLDFAFVRLLQSPENRPLSCAVIDIDHFKTLNDGYGHQVGDEVIVEWRALTVALLDRVAEGVQKKLGVTAAELPLACVLEGGTWAAGRAVAAELRPGGAPPIQIHSDGTVF